MVLLVLAQIHIGIPRSMHCWHCSESYHFVEHSNHPQLLETTMCAAVCRGLVSVGAWVQLHPQIFEIM